MMEKTVVVRDCMNRKVVSFDINDRITDVVATLLEHKITGAPVLDSQKQVIGFISEQDCIKEMLNTAFYCDLTCTAADVMKTDVVTVDPDMQITQLAEQLNVNRPKIYPVVENGKLIGVVSRADVLQYLYEVSASCRQVPDRKVVI